MAARPLPGATYHTADFAFHSSPDADLEAVDSYGPSEKEPSTLESRIHLPIQTHDKARTRRGPPVLLILLLLCCLAFVVSAFTGGAFDDDDDLPLSCVPERLAPLAQQISAEFRTAPHAERVYVTQERALHILKQSTIPPALVATPLMCATTCGDLTPLWNLRSTGPMCLNRPLSCVGKALIPN
ncbi:hypothetical protein EDB84DRAFT_346820 [Lactarius hengduanensis]|nr:hypothetical protein EDB84DRAFT_346820 [Lactarius hengduanensis]